MDAAGRSRLGEPALEGGQVLPQIGGGGVVYRPYLLGEIGLVNINLGEKEISFCEREGQFQEKLALGVRGTRPSQNLAAKDEDPVVLVRFGRSKACTSCLSQITSLY